MNKNLNFFNTLSNKKEKFVPININKIGMYVCGPTVYDDPHIGNARPLVIFDILFKVLKCKFGNKNVTYVRNITDIDDKIIQSSLERKISTQELTDKIIKNFHEDCIYLGCENPNFEPKATENISLMIEKKAIKTIGWSFSGNLLFGIGFGFLRGLVFIAMIILFLEDTDFYTEPMIQQAVLLEQAEEIADFFYNFFLEYYNQ